MNRLDRVSRLLRYTAVAVFVIAMLVKGYGLDIPGPRSGPGHVAAASPDHAAVRWVDIEPTPPAVRSATRFEARDREAGKVYAGTAFATGARDVWATARHVAEGCRRVGLRHGSTIEAVSQVVHHRGTDLSLLIAPERGAIEPASDSYLPLEAPHLDGFAMGYPGGNEATVHLGYLMRIGAHVVDDSGREHRSAGGLWQIRSTGLFDAPDLSGISGGPLLARNGNLLGVVVGGQPRRARAVTIDPVNLRELLVEAGVPAERSSPLRIGIDIANGDAVRKRLIRDGLLAQVICQT